MRVAACTVGPRLPPRSRKASSLAGPTDAGRAGGDFETGLKPSTGSTALCSGTDAVAAAGTGALEKGME
ncbi:MAG: hypothetical protein AMXMBFR33_07240 [Candidatus Xenobia bacterium]